MRVTILFLIFLNAAFYYWAHEKDFSQAIYADAGAVPGIAPIELLSERGVPNSGQNNSIQNTNA